MIKLRSSHLLLALLLWLDQQQTGQSRRTRNNQIWFSRQRTARQSEESADSQQHQVAASFSNGQCPLLDTKTADFLNHTSSHGLVQVDPATGRRTFQARIVAIFSCLDSDLAGNDLTLDFRLAKPVIDLAVRAINQKYQHLHFDVTYRTAPDICKHQQAAGHAADEYYVNGANYIVGPGCSESLASVGQLASYWNVPMCSTGYLPEVVTARFNPLTLMQLSLSVQSVGEMLLELFRMNRWRHLVIVTDEKHPLHSLIRDGLLEFFHTMYMLSGGGRQQSSATASEQHKQPRGDQQRPFYYINITSRNFAHSNGKQAMVDYDQVMLDAASYSRVMLFLARSTNIESLLQAAHRQGMSKGQFVFIAHELFEIQQVSNSEQERNQVNQNQFALDEKIEIQAKGDNSTKDQLTREIYAPLMTIALRIPTTPEYDTFRQQVAGLSEREFNYRIQPSSLKSLYSLGVAAFIHDCVMLYADKVDYLLRETQFSKIDGRTIFQQSAGKTFKGALTGDLTINRAGQRVIDFTLNDFAPKTLQMEPIAHFLALERRLVFLDGRQPHWAVRNQSVPRSDPRCRIADLFCRYSEELDGEPTAGNGLYHGQASTDRFVLGVWLLVIIVVSVGFTSSAIGWLVYRRFRIESELLNLWWSIKYEDILFEDEQDVLCDGKRSMSSLAISNESFNERTAGAANESSGRASPITPSQQSAAARQAGPPDSQSVGASNQLSVCHSLGQDGQSILASTHSGSALSVSATPSLGATAGGSAATAAAAGSAPTRLAQSAGASKLIPQLIGQQTAAARALNPSGKSSGSGKFASPAASYAQLGGKQTTKGANPATGNSLAANPAASQTAASAKDPSISSQNKNAKLRLGTVLNGGRDQAHTTKVGLYKASRVAAKHLNVRNLNINRQLLIELRQVRDLTHENLIKFIGLCPEEPNVAIVSELCTRGNLQDLLQNETIRLDWPFRYSIINDIVDGLIHLHSSPIQYHGRLKSSNCVIDNRFVVKLTDFGLPTLLSSVEDEESVNPRLLLWTAPEHLRTKRPLLSGSPKGDIYSLAIIFQEIITRCGPFECEPILCGASELGAPIDWHSTGAAAMAPVIRATDAGGQLIAQRRPQQQRQQPPLATAGMMMQPVVVQHKQRLEPEEIVNLVRMGLSPPFRPYFRPDVATSQAAGDFSVADLIGLVQTCWQEAPALRPTVASVKQQIKKMRRGCHLDGANLMDNLLQRMERYTDNLESLVEQKTAELMEEKKRSEELLYEMLPRFVVDQLKYGHSVTPEAYEAVTISFSDIKDFTSIAAQSSPIEVVNLLNQLYTEFDDCIARYDVYKVETIGDAYMVVSGLPVRNGDQHAREIAEMSLALLELIRNFHVAHLPHVNLELRIGIHSGPCASGVVGTRMFRYCLFGDTVNTASRMESHGEPMKIHISEDSAQILNKFGTFLIEPRGQVDIKGKGLMNTFWLLAKRQPLS